MKCRLGYIISLLIIGSSLIRANVVDTSKYHFKILPTAWYLNKDLYQFGVFSKISRGVNSTKISTAYNTDKSLSLRLKMSKVSALNNRKILTSFSYLNDIDSRIDNKDLTSRFNVYRLENKLFLKENDTLRSSINTRVQYGVKNYYLFNSLVDIEKVNLPMFIFNLEYEHKKTYDNFISHFRPSIEFNNNKTAFLVNKSLLRLNLKQTVSYKIDKKRWLSLGVIGSYFLINPDRKVLSFSNDLVRASAGLSVQGSNDYAYNQQFMNRRGKSNFSSNQVGGDEDDFYLIGTNNFNIGLTNDFLYGFTSRVDVFDIRKFIFAKAYFQIGQYAQSTASTKSIDGLFTSGLVLKIGQYGQIILPIVSSTNIKTTHTQSKWGYLNRIGFRFDFCNF